MPTSRPMISMSASRCWSGAERLPRSDWIKLASVPSGPRCTAHQASQFSPTDLANSRFRDRGLGIYEEQHQNPRIIRSRGLGRPYCARPIHGRVSPRKVASSRGMLCLWQIRTTSYFLEWRGSPESLTIPNTRLGRDAPIGRAAAAMGLYSHRRHPECCLRNKLSDPGGEPPASPALMASKSRPVPFESI